MCRGFNPNHDIQPNNLCIFYEIEKYYFNHENNYLFDEKPNCTY